MPLVLLSLAGCQSLPGTPDVLAAAAAAPAAELAPVILPPIARRAPIEEPDLIVRIRAGLELSPSGDKAVQREAAWYARHQQHIDRLFERGSRYLFHIVESLEERGMPLDLALLPIVESAFDPFAYSHWRASGLWQIIPSTGKVLGLKQNWWYDGRRDVLESTRAALDYLEALHQRFDGDWLLAVAGYNSGEGNVARAIRRATADGRPTDFWGVQRYLPAETRTYVPRFLAIRELVASPHKHGITIPPVANEPYFAAVETGGQIDMALAASLAGLAPADLYALNAGVSRWATDPEGPHRLLVPAAVAPAFSVALAGLGPHELIQWSRHKIEPGETVGALAARYHTTVAVLREVNELKTNLMIRAGDYLLVPHASEATGVYAHSAQARSQVTQSVVSAAADGVAARPRIVPATSPVDAVRQITYVVRPGDSLSLIARRFRVTVAKILEWNRVSAEQYLLPGQRLVMFTNVLEQTT